MPSTSLERFLTTACLPERARTALLDAFGPLEYPKGYRLLQPGRVCTHLYFLETGLVREYQVSADGRERNEWFSLEGDWVTSLHSFSRQQPNPSHFQLLEDSQLRGITYAHWQSLLAGYPAVERLYRLVLEEYLVRVEERAYDLQFLSARERYEKFLRHYPMLLQRVPLGQIASYLNVTPETLSRLRGER